jgi:hypothetical protein
VFLAARGRREHDADGPPRFDGNQLVMLQRQARRVWLLASSTGLGLTAAGVLLAIAAN